MKLTRLPLDFIATWDLSCGKFVIYFHQMFNDVANTCTYCGGGNMHHVAMKDHYFYAKVLTHSEAGACLLLMHMTIII